MLSRPDVGSYDHIKMWLANKAEGEVYEWASPVCPQGQYFKEHNEPLDERTWPDAARLNQLASKFKTFGDLSNAF